MARIVRKEIKQPDAFQTYGRAVFSWFIAHQNKFLIGAGAVILLAAAVAGYRLWRERVQRQAAIAYAAATASGTAGENTEAALRKTARQYAGTRGGILAQLHLAQLLRQRGAQQEAEEEYNQLLAGRGASPQDRELAQRGLAAALAAQGKCGDALPIWREILSRGSLFTPEDLYLAIAACHESQGRPADALKTYEELSQKFPNSPYLTERLREKMRRLAGRP